ncbi:MAG TPA: histidine kinase [Acidimicrobiales bacterium]|nr:histidine kinase [Acidimicrobiales bacterium]
MGTSADHTLDPGAGAISTRLNLAGLGLLVWGVTSEIAPDLGERRVAGAFLLAAATLGWCGWALSRFRPARRTATASLAVMAVAGGALVPVAALAMTFAGAAALGATIRCARPVALAVALAGPCSMLVASAFVHPGQGVAIGCVAATLAGAAMGLGRRETLERAAQAALVEVSAARAEAERARAELLAGRNHLARELHDVLAHTLSALSLQLEAFDSLIGAERAPRPEVHEHLERTKRLVREGLEEARGAVRALREDAPPLAEQLVDLAGERRAAIAIHGAPRRIAPEVALALYRVAQEALTNVVKHAPGAPAEVSLAFGDDRVTLAVTNSCEGERTGSALASSGSGYGLQGIRERVLLVGGRVDAGPTERGWRVEAEVPA